MKKFVIRICAMTLFAAMTLSLSACSSVEQLLLRIMDDEQKIEYIMNKADERVEGASSYEMEISGDFTASVQGMEVKVTTSGTEVLSNIGEKDFSCLTVTKNVMSMNSGASSSVSTTTEGYQNGKMFMTFEGDGKTQKLWSEISAEEYLEHKEAMDDEEDPDEENAGRREITEEEDGTFVLLFTDFPEEELEYFAASLNPMLATLDVSCWVSDIEYKITVSKDYYPESVSINIIFAASHGTDDVPEFTMDCEYRSFNKADAPEVLSLSEYTEVDDLRWLDILDDRLNDRINSDEGEYELSITSEYSAGNGASQSDSQTSKLSYARSKGKLQYTLTTVVDKYDCKVTYSNGKEKTVITMSGTDDKSVQTVDVTEAQAQYNLEALLNPCDFSSDQVLDIIVNNGVCTFELDAASDIFFETLCAELDGNLKEGSKTLELDLEENRDELKSVVIRYRAVITTAEFDIEWTQTYLCNYADA